MLLSSCEGISFTASNTAVKITVLYLRLQVLMATSMKMAVLCDDVFIVLMMEAVTSSETSSTFTTLHCAISKKSAVFVIMHIYWPSSGL
jgi:hypothetical protein